MTKCRKVVLYILFLIFGLSLAVFIMAGCNNKKEETVPPVTQPVILYPPQNVRITGSTLYWDGVENASLYEITVDEKIFQTEQTEYSLIELQTANTYKITVKAVGDGVKYNTSGASKIVFYTVLQPTAGLEYTLLEDNTYAVANGNATSNNIVIPDYYNGKAVTQIAERGFFRCENITSVKLPATLKKIGDRAFWRASIKQIELPEGLEYIGDSAFSCVMVIDLKNKTQLDSINFPQSLKHIGDYAFENNNFTEVVIPDDIEYLGEGAFRGCEKLKKVVLPESLTYISDQIFNTCVVLSSVNIPECVEYIGDFAFNHCLALAEVTLPANLKYLGYNAFSSTAWYTNWLSQQPDGLVTINNILMGYKGEMPENFKAESLPEGVNVIAGGAFAKCTNLTAFNAEKCISIGRSAFQACSSLKEIYIPDSVTLIGTFSFYYCVALEYINLPVSLTDIGESAFSGCKKLTQITVHENLSGLNIKSVFGSLAITVYAEGQTSIQYEGAQGAVLFNCVLSEDKSYVISLTKNKDNVYPQGVAVNDPCRKGYTFGGWTTVEGGTVAEYTSEDIKTIANGTKLYAIWIANS